MGLRFHKIWFENFAGFITLSTRIREVFTLFREEGLDMRWSVIANEARRAKLPI